MTVTLPADLQAFVDEQVELGYAAEVNAAVAEAVRELQRKKNEEKLAWLRAALDEGEADVTAVRVIRGPINARQMLEEVRQKNAAK